MSARAAGPVLVVNTGSSSIKLSVVQADGTEAAGTVLDHCDIDRWHPDEDADALRACLDRLAGPGRAGSGQSASAPVAVGHRVVHGGSRFTSATLIDDTVLARISELTPLAPLHQPRALAGIAAARAALPRVPHVACFDTAFHATMPPQAFTYPLPASWRERFGLRKYGFHGLSHAFASRRAAQMLPSRKGQQLAVVTCHLGAGSSLAAVMDGRSVETTMGFTPLDGLVMATRCGSVDPGLLIWLASTGGIPVPDLADELEHSSGLAGLAGLPGSSGDMRDVLAAAGRGEPAAELAFGVYTHRLVAEIASMAAAMNGIDALAFTGGIGEHAPAVRAAAAAGLRFLGVAIDPDRNAVASADADITGDGARVRTLVVTAREDHEIARQTIQALDVG